MCVQTKLQFQAVLDQVFPAYKGVFGSMYSGISLRFLSEFPTSYSVLQTDEDSLKAKMKELLSSKRGSSQLRYALVMAVQCGLIRSRNTRIKEFYDRKRSEGKPHKVALVACANKLVHWLYAS
ncbi:hypothetical protein D3C76_876070 [compost metagenome]